MISHITPLGSKFGQDESFCIAFLCIIMLHMQVKSQSTKKMIIGPD